MVRQGPQDAIVLPWSECGDVEEQRDTMPNNEQISPLQRESHITCLLLSLQWIALRVLRGGEQSAALGGAKTQLRNTMPSIATSNMSNHNTPNRLLRPQNYRKGFKKIARHSNYAPGPRIPQKQKVTKRLQKKMRTGIEHPTLGCTT